MSKKEKEKGEATYNQQHTKGLLGINGIKTIKRGLGGLKRQQLCGLDCGDPLSVS